MSSYNKNTWNYDRPNCSWESMPWQIRWPFGLGAILYFGGGILIGIMLLLGVKL